MFGTTCKASQSIARESDVQEGEQMEEGDEWQNVPVKFSDEGLLIVLRRRKLVELNAGARGDGGGFLFVGGRHD